MTDAANKQWKFITKTYFVYVFSRVFFHLFFFVQFYFYVLVRTRKEPTHSFWFESQSSCQASAWLSDFFVLLLLLFTTFRLAIWMWLNNNNNHFLFCTMRTFKLSTGFNSNADACQIESDKNNQQRIYYYSIEMNTVFFLSTLFGWDQSVWRHFLILYLDFSVVRRVWFFFFSPILTLHLARHRSSCAKLERHSYTIKWRRIRKQT